MKRGLSYQNRGIWLQKMSEEELDLLVIGGGITGAGIALDATLRGLKVGLVEMQDFAAGTSSRSTKLIHGGLRYLKQGNFHLVREVGRERTILHRNASHLVIPEKMLLPIIKGGTYGKTLTSIALWLYDHLAGVDRTERRQMLSKQETLEQEPLLRSDLLIGSGLYVEYRTDDARLTIEVIKTAVKHGAIAVNYAKVEQLLYEHKQLIGVIVKDHGDDREYQIRARRVVNATGPWVDGIRSMDHSLRGKRLHLTKGVHIVVSHERCPVAQSVYFDTQDGRMIFAIPRGNKTYIGTTDTNYEGELDHPQVHDEDRNYLLSAANWIFPSIQLRREDIEAEWAGLRPLIHEGGKSPSELSRKDEIFVSDSGLISIAGGKLTGYRKMAERVVDLLCKELSVEVGRSFPASSTSQAVLSGGIIGSRKQLKEYTERAIHLGEQRGINSIAVKELVQRYGTNVESIYAYIDEKLKEEAEEFGLPISLIAEIRYGMEEEMVVKAEDFLVRRSSLFLFGRERYDEWKEKVITYINQFAQNKLS